MKNDFPLEKLLSVLLILFSLATGLMADTDGAVDDLLQEMEKDANKDDLALIKNSFLGDLRFWNGVDSDSLSGKEKARKGKDGVAEDAVSWGWKYNTRTGRIERIPGKNIPISAMLSIPKDGAYRVWLRRVADNIRPCPVELKLSGSNKLEHTFGKFALTRESSKNQEKAFPIRFEDEAIRTAFPVSACQVWEYWDLDLKKGDTLFELSSAQKDAQFSHIFISGSKSFTPVLPREQYTILLLRDQYQSSTLSRVYFRFKVRDAGVNKYRFTHATLMYHWKFDPKDETFGEGIWWVGLGQESLVDRRRPVPLSTAGKPDIACGEWTDWLDATWATQGSGPWATGILDFAKLKKGKCDIELAWQANPAAVVKTITTDIDNGTAKFCVPLINKGMGKVVFPDRSNKTGVWGFFGQKYLDLFKNIDGFNQQYLAWIKEAREKMGITQEPRLPSGLNFITRALGGPSEQRALGKTLVFMGFNALNEMPPDICKELGIEPLVTSGANCHTSDPADPARPIIVKEALDSLLKQNLQAIPDYAQLLRIICVGDEIGPIASTYKINQSVECLKRFRQYLARFLKENQQTPQFFGVESLDDLEGLERLPRNPGIFERRLYNHSAKFRQILTGDYYRSITETAKTMFPNVLTYANYSPAPLRQGEQTHSLTWFSLLRQGALSLAWGEDWCYRICSFTGYEIVSYYAAMTECAARKLKCPSGFYNVPCCLRSDTNIVSILSRNIKYVYLFSFGPAYNDTSAEEGSWSDIEAVYPEIVKATHVASFVGRNLAEGKIEERKVALLYNTDQEIMNGGHHGEQSDRALTFAALGNCHYNAELILNEDLSAEILKQYSVLFINGFCLPRASVPVIREWVKNGGLLIASANSATCDEYNLPLPEMEEIFGAKQFNMSVSSGYIEPLTLYRHKPIGKITVQETEFSPALTADVIGMRTSLLPGTAQSIATFEDGTCAAALNKIGQGYVLLWGVQPGIIYKGQREGANNFADEMSRYVDERLAIFEKPLHKVLGPSPLSCNAPQVELTRFDLEDQSAILVNNFKRYAWTADLAPMEIKIKLKDKQNVSTASSAMYGTLQCKKDGEWLTVSSPVPPTIDSILLK